jgi:hypothetical protein
VPHVVHDVAEPVVAALGGADLRALHEDHARAGCTADSASITSLRLGRAAGPPGAGRPRRGCRACDAARPIPRR